MRARIQLALSLTQCRVIARSFSSLSVYLDLFAVSTTLVGVTGLLIFRDGGRTKIRTCQYLLPCLPLVWLLRTAAVGTPKDSRRNPRPSSPSSLPPFSCIALYVTEKHFSLRFDGRRRRRTGGMPPSRRRRRGRRARPRGRSAEQSMGPP